MCCTSTGKLPGSGPEMPSPLGDGGGGGECREMLGGIQNERVMETVGDGDWGWSTTLYIP